MLHAFYSTEHAFFFGTAVYRRKDGTEVHVTAVSEDKDYANDPKRYGVWADTVYAGEVEQYVREGLRGCFSPAYSEAYSFSYDEVEKY